MNLNTQLLELDEAVCRLSWGVNAVGAVSQAILCVGHAYADGLHAVWEYLYDALDSLRSNLDLLMEQSRPAAPQPQ